MGQSQSWNTNTSIFYVHECEKKETTRPMETEQAMGAQTSRVSFRRAAIAGRQSHPRKALLQSRDLQVLQAWGDLGVEVAFLA